MHNVKLSARLSAIAQLVPNGAKIADIGSDHALLPVHLAQAGTISAAIAGELNDGPYESARSKVESLQLTSLIDVRQGDGLEVVRPGEADTVVIAGMGGSLICSILERGQKSLSSVHRLILQPNVAEKLVRMWLIKNRWALRTEILLQEDGVFYEILMAERTDEADDYNEALYQSFIDACGNEITKELQLEMGPFLLRQRESLLPLKWQTEQKKLARVIENLANSKAEDAAVKRQQLLSLYSKVEEVLQCLQKDKP